MCSKVCPSSGINDLRKGYGIFVEEDRNLDPDYEIGNINIDDWEAIRITLKIFIQRQLTDFVFLHGYISIRDRCRKSQLYYDVGNAAWYVFSDK